MMIRKMKKTDAEQAALICAETGLHSWSAASFENEAENPIAVYLVLEEDGMMVGFAGIWCVVDEAQVMNIGILPAFQGKGYGKKLMQGIIEAGAKEGCSVMTLEVKNGNQPAIGLYTGLGFRQTGLRKNYYPDHSDGVLMERKLLDEA